MDAFVFLLTGIIAIFAAALVVTRRNPVYSAIFLVLFFTMISLNFLVLRAPFLAVIQVLVYAGAIMVLFLFVIMLLNLTSDELRERVPGRRKVFAALASAGVFLLLATAIYKSPTVQGTRGTAAADLTAPVTDPALAVAGETAAMGHALFDTYVLPFEYTSILIFVAIVAAVFLTKRRTPQPEEESQAESAGTSPLESTVEVPIPPFAEATPDTPAAPAKEEHA